MPRRATHLHIASSQGQFFIFNSQLLLRIRKKHRFRGAFSLSIKSIYRFYFSCGSTHKIEFAQQIHNSRGAWPRPPSLAAMRQFTLCTSGIIQGTKNCARRARLFVKIRLKAWFQSRGCSKNGVFRQPQSCGLTAAFLVCSDSMRYSATYGIIRIQGIQSRRQRRTLQLIPSVLAM